MPAGTGLGAATELHAALLCRVARGTARPRGCTSWSSQPKISTVRPEDVPPWPRAWPTHCSLEEPSAPPPESPQGSSRSPWSPQAAPLGDPRHRHRQALSGRRAGAPRTGRGRAAGRARLGQGARRASARGQSRRRDPPGGPVGPDARQPAHPGAGSGEGGALKHGCVRARCAAACTSWRGARLYERVHGSGLSPNGLRASM
jgi:hypothetical protein